MYLADSFEIAQYLDQAYPDAPKIFPYGTAGMQRGFQTAFRELFEPIIHLLVPIEYDILTPASQRYFKESREKMYRRALEDILPKGEERQRNWKTLKDNFGVLNEWYSMSNNPGPFLLGDIPSWADFVVGAIFTWGKLIWGKESAEWKEIETWHGGRWSVLLDSLAKYNNVA